MIYRRYTVALSAGKARKHCVSLGINYVTDRVYCTVIRGEIERNPVPASHASTRRSDGNDAT
jgi:hypothetical protein